MAVVKFSYICASYFLLVTFVIINGFNLNWRHARVFSDPRRQNGSYFGFTVAFRKEGLNQWLIVGAPRGNSTYYEHRQIYQPGVIYKCNMEKEGSCQQLVIDANDTTVQYGVDGNRIRHNKRNSWLGGAIAVENNGDRMVVCAPRWKNSYYTDFNLMNGACYTTYDSIEYGTKRLLLPLVDLYQQSVRNYFYYAYGEAGFSAHFPKNNAELVLGAPGVLHWAGTIIRMRNPKIFGGSTSIYTITDIPDPLSSHSVYTNSYLGYALSSGRFLKDRSSHLYVTSAPRNEGAKVFVFDFPKNNNEFLKIIIELEGTQLGEYFGGALCVVDLNGDELDDLIVGAPQYSLPDKGDEGRIYVFINSDRGTITETTENMMIMGERQQDARFGTAVANAGDLNRDGYEDIAVGAPYEGNGVVYIYHGSKSGLRNRPVQVIYGKDIDAKINGFGIGFSKGADIDGNNYNDIAVGAFKSGHAVVLRGHPIIAFESTLTTSKRSVSQEIFNFSTSACLKYTGWNVPEHVNTKVTLQVDTTYGRAYFVSKDFGKSKNYTYSMRLRRGGEWCKRLQVEKVPYNISITEPLLLVMKHELAYNPNEDQTRRNNDQFCKECPVVDINEPNFISKMVAFETGCKSDICQTDLLTDARITGFKDKFIIGEAANLQLEIDVKNIQEPAYLTQATLLLPRSTSIVKLPSNCQELSMQYTSETQQLSCDIGNPLKESFKFKILMTTEKVSINEKNLTFKINVTSVGYDVNPDDNYKEVVLQLATQANMRIAGISSHYQIVYTTESNTFRNNLTFYHKFQIRNMGPSSVYSARIEFNIPYQYIVSNGKHSFMKILEPKSSSQITCKPENGFEYWIEDSDREGFNPAIDNVNMRHEEYDEDFNDFFKKKPPSMSKRSVPTDEASNNKSVRHGTSDYPLLPANRTLFLNCFTSQVDCVKVICSGGPFIPNKSVAVINFQLKPIFEDLELWLQQKHIILFSSVGKITVENPPSTIQPNGHKIDGVTVHTIFIGKLPEGVVPKHVIGLAIITGVLILLLICMAIYKMGFFKRGMKEELQALKDAEVVSGDAAGDDCFHSEVITSDIDTEAIPDDGVGAGCSDTEDAAGGIDNQGFSSSDVAVSKDE